MLDRPLLLNIDDGVVESTTDPLVFNKQVIYVGDFIKHREDGSVDYRFAVDEPTIDHWVKTHQELLEAGVDVPMPIKHTDDPLSRAATVLRLSKRLDSKGRQSMFAELKFKTPKLAEELKDSQVSLYSPRLYAHNGKQFVRPVRHVCFTDYPVVGDLDPLTIAASYDRPKEKNMNLKTLAKNLGIELKDDDDDAAIADKVVAEVKKLKKSIKASEDLTIDLRKEIDAVKKVPTSDPVKQDPFVVKLARDNRAMKIDALLSEHKIDAAAAKRLKEHWAGDALALSEDNDAAFQSVMETLTLSKPMSVLGAEQSPAQRFDRDKNSLVQDAQKRADAAKK